MEQIQLWTQFWSWMDAHPWVLGKTTDTSVRGLALREVCYSCPYSGTFLAMVCCPQLLPLARGHSQLSASVPFFSPSHNWFIKSIFVSSGFRNGLETVYSSFFEPRQLVLSGLLCFRRTHQSPPGRETDALLPCFRMWLLHVCRLGSQHLKCHQQFLRNYLWTWSEPLAPCLLPRPFSWDSLSSISKEMCINQNIYCFSFKFWLDICVWELGSVWGRVLDTPRGSFGSQRSVHRLSFNLKRGILGYLDQKRKVGCRRRVVEHHGPSYCIRPGKKSQIKLRSRGTKPWEMCPFAMDTPLDPLLPQHPKPLISTQTCW